MANAIDVRLGTMLRERRTALRMSQSKVAENLGISFQQWQKYEAGLNRISVSRFVEVCSILEVPTSYFLDTLMERPRISERL